MKKDTPKAASQEEKQHTVEQDETYQHMYRIRYPDGVLSADMYGQIWATEHCRRLNEIQESGKDGS